MVYKSDWNKAFEAQGHKARLDDQGGPDFLAYAYRDCNGPVCIYCNESFCDHCTRPDRISPCRENSPKEGFPMNLDAEAAAALFREAVAKGDLEEALDALIEAKSPLSLIKKYLGYS